MRVRIITIFIFLLIFPSQVFAQIQRPNMMNTRRAGIFIIRTRPTKEQKKKLLPNPLDLKKYEQFLMQPKTGIFRLMPDIGCTENINIIRADDACLNFIPESSYYSFREDEHTMELLADIRLRNGYLISDGILAQGILVQLGETALEQVSPGGAGLKFLAEYAPNPLGSEAQKQYMQMIRGVRVGDYEYKKALPAIENATYVLRVVAYRGNIFRVSRGYRFDLLEGDKRIDLTVAFRVVRKDQDGGLTLLWKEIGRKDAPRIIFPNRKK